MFHPLPGLVLLVLSVVLTGGVTDWQLGRIEQVLEAEPEQVQPATSDASGERRSKTP